MGPTPSHLAGRLGHRRTGRALRTPGPSPPPLGLPAAQLCWQRQRLCGSFLSESGGDRVRGAQSGRRLKMKVLVGGGRGCLLASSPWLSWDGHQSSGFRWLFGLGWDWTGRSGSRPSSDPCGPTRLSRLVPSEGHFWGWLQPGGGAEPSQAPGGGPEPGPIPVDSEWYSVWAALPDPARSSPGPGIPEMLPIR